MRRKKEAQLRQYVFFQLRVHLKNGSDLVAMDKNGKSGRNAGGMGGMNEVLEL